MASRAEVDAFSEKLIDLHGKLCRGTLFENRRDAEFLIGLVEGLTNITTGKDLDIFNALCLIDWSEK